MELVKIIYQEFGGREMERIFRNYLFISLLFKQLIFSLFSLPADVYDKDSVPADNNPVFVEIVSTDASEESLDGIQVFKLMWTLALIETKKPTAPNELTPIN